MAHKLKKNRARVPRDCGIASRQRKEVKESAKPDAAERQREADKVRAIERERRFNLPAGDNNRLFVYKGAVKGVDRSGTKKRTPAQLEWIRQIDAERAKAEKAAKASDSRESKYEFPEPSLFPPPVSFDEHIEAIDRAVRDQHRLGQEEIKENLALGPITSALSRSEKAASNMKALKDAIQKLWRDNARAQKKWSAEDVRDHLMRPNKSAEYFPGGLPWPNAKTLLRKVKEALALLRKRRQPVEART